MSKKPPIQGGSSLGPDVLEEYLALVEEMEGKPKDAGIPEEFDDILLGQHAKDDAEKNYQKGQEVAITLATTGWVLIEESMVKMVGEARKEHESDTITIRSQNSDGTESSEARMKTEAEILQSYRDWKAMEKAVQKILANARSAAQVPHPDELPEG